MSAGRDQQRTCACGCGNGVRGTWAKGHHRRRPVRDRLLEKVIEGPDGCWVWTGAINTNGYGAIGTGVGKATGQTHRVAYELFIGPIPEGLHIDHLCRNRLCVNPAHLEAVTQAVNNQRMWDANPKPTCRRGHEISGANQLFVAARTRATCRTCHNYRGRAGRRGISVEDYLKGIA